MGQEGDAEGWASQNSVLSKVGGWPAGPPACQAPANCQWWGAPQGQAALPPSSVGPVSAPSLPLSSSLPPLEACRTLLPCSCAPHNPTSTPAPPPTRPPARPAPPRPADEGGAPQGGLPGGPHQRPGGGPSPPAQAGPRGGPGQDHPAPGQPGRSVHLSMHRGAGRTRPPSASAWGQPGGGWSAGSAGRGRGLSVFYARCSPFLAGEA